MNDTLRQREARAYHRAGRRLGLVSGTCSLVVVAAAVAAAGPLGGWWALAILGPGLWLVELPFGYAGYRRSRRYGLSRQTAGGWLGDRLKGAAVGAVLGAVVAAGLIACQRAWPGGWPLAAWIAMVAFTAALAVLWPLVLLPIFLSSEPLTDGEVAEELWRTAREAHVQVRELRLLKMGEKTSAANAMVAGFGPTRRIYVGDTLLEERDREGPEVLRRVRVILAHELGHQVHGDLWRLLAMSAATTAAGVAGTWAAVAAFAPHGAGHLDTLPAAALGYGLAAAVVSPLAATYSRRLERAADRYAVRVTGAGEAFARAMERMVVQNLSELDPPRLYHLLTGTHPTPRERIETARAGQD